MLTLPVGCHGSMHSREVICCCKQPSSYGCVKKPESLGQGLNFITRTKWDFIFSWHSLVNGVEAVAAIVTTRDDERVFKSCLGMSIDGPPSETCKEI